MDIYKEQIERIVQEQKKILDSYTREYAGCIDGSLIHATNNGNKYYYHSRKQGDRYIRKTIDQDSEIARELARKEYLDRSIEAVKRNVGLLENTYKRMSGIGVEDIRPQMRSAYKELPEGLFYGAANAVAGVNVFSGYDAAIRRHTAWAKEPYQMSTYRPEGTKYPTSIGLKVRSKSEQILVEELVFYGVPFRYEQVLVINGVYFSPDFSFQCFNDRLLYWEHAGMMNNPLYASRHKRKMQTYESVGIVPWENLIVTYDVDDYINIPMVKSIIENEVIPRL